MDVLQIAIALGLIVGAVVLAYFVFASFVFGAGYQPTPARAVEMMLRLAEVGPGDVVFDLGAGTGAIVFRAARTYRARVIGSEVEPVRVLILRLRRRWGPERDRITIRWGDLFHLDFREATVVTTFLWPGAMERLRPKFEAELTPGARVVSYYHPVPHWTPERHEPETNVYLYRWPSARPAGGAPPDATGGGS
jgi:hypothetical protein